MAEKSKQKPNFKAFADDILKSIFEDETLDGADIQDIALKHNIIVEYIATKPCCENCVCKEIVDEFPVQCYKKNY
jgi:hypothetical protein